MLSHPRPAARNDAAALSALIERGHRLSEAIEEQNTELRLAVMQAKIRLAELKATLRAIQRHL